MTISSLDPSGELGRLFSTSQPKQVAPNDQRPSTSIQSAPTRDDVALSHFAQEVRDLTDRVSRYPDIRHDRVQAIRQKLEQSQSLANSEQIANALARETIINSLA